MSVALEGGEWSAAHPGRNLPPGKTRYPFYRRLGGPQGRSGQGENLVPTWIRSRTIQPVAQSLYRLSYPVVFYRLFIIHYQAIWYHIPESDILYSHHYQNLASHNCPVQQIILHNSFDTGSADRAVGTSVHSICALQ